MYGRAARSRTRQEPRPEQRLLQRGTKMRLVSIRTPTRVERVPEQLIWGVSVRLVLPLSPDWPRWGCRYGNGRSVAGPAPCLGGADTLPPSVVAATMRCRWTETRRERGNDSLLLLCSGRHSPSHRFVDAPEYEGAGYMNSIL